MEFFGVQQFVTCRLGENAETPLAKDAFAVYPSKPPAIQRRAVLAQPLAG